MGKYTDYSDRRYFLIKSKRKMSEKFEVDIDVRVESPQITVGKIGLEFGGALEIVPYSSAILTFGKMVGLLPSDSAHLKEAIAEISRAIAALKTELIDWLEDSELRDTRAEVLSIGPSIEAYYASNSETFRHSILAEMFLHFSRMDALLPHQVDRLLRAKHYERALHYFSLFNIDLANRIALQQISVSRQQDLNEISKIRDHVSSDSLLKTSSLAHVALTQYVLRNVPYSFAMSALRRPGTFQLMTSIGYQEFGSFVQIGERHQDIMIAVDRIHVPQVMNLRRQRCLELISAWWGQFNLFQLETPPIEYPSESQANLGWVRSPPLNPFYQ